MKGVNLKKATVILGVIFISALLAVITISRNSANTAVMSQLSGDDVQNGFVVSLGEYMYFPNPSDNNKIYKIKADGTGKAKVSDDRTNTLALADKWIYYSNLSDGGKLYRIDVDGTKRTEMTKYGANYINISIAGIYYSNLEDGNKLYRIGFNGKGNTRLSDESISDINVVGSSIIYRNASQQIIKIISDGTGRTVMEEQKIAFVKADNDGRIYFLDQEEDSTLYSMDEKGVSSTTILKTSTYNVEPFGEWIYFINNRGGDLNTYPTCIYRVKKDGTGLQRISIEGTDEFFIHKDKIFYKSLENDRKIYTMNLDGSQRKAMDGKTIANSVIEICSALKDKVDFDITNDKMSEAYKRAKEVLSEIIKPGMSQLEKEISIHDYLVKNVKYDNQVINALNNDYMVNFDSHDAYNVLINGKGVCDGFAWTTKLMLGMCGIDSDIVTGMGKTGDDNKIQGKTLYHAWNIVKIDDEYYQVDVTWDEGYYEQLDMLCYKYFNISDDLMAKDHEWDKSYYTKATSIKYNFFNNLEAGSRDGNTVYYSNLSDNYKLYRINIDGSGNKKINDHKDIYISVSQGWVYYSDYDDGGALYKITTEGRDKTMLKSDWCINIEVKDGYVEYINHKDKKKYKIKI